MPGVAIRVSARTFAYDKQARPELAPDHRQVSQRPRYPDMLPREVPEDTWHFHDTPSAQLFMSRLAQPRRASKSPSSTRNRHVAAGQMPGQLADLRLQPLQRHRERAVIVGEGTVGVSMQSIEHVFDASARL